MARPEAAERALSFAIAEAIDDLCQEMERYHARHEHRQRLTRCLAAAARLIRDLEDLSLAGRPVPAEWQPRLDRFVAALPPDLDADLRAGADPHPLLDQVQEIEERLYRFKLGEWTLVFDRHHPSALAGEGRGGGAVGSEQIGR